MMTTPSPIGPSPPPPPTTMLQDSVAETGGGTEINEAGTTDTFTVVLNAKPSSDVVISAFH